MADELQNDFALVLPTLVFDDRMSLDMGDITIQLIWLGRAGNCNGLTIVVIPQDKIAITPGMVLHESHLAPYPFNEFKELDVPRWIEVLSDILEGEQAVETVVCNVQRVKTAKWARTRLDYIRRLWSEVRSAKDAGLELSAIQERLSLDRAFSFVKNMDIYKKMGDDWTRPQHMDHVRLFFLQEE